MTCVFECAGADNWINLECNRDLNGWPAGIDAGASVFRQYPACAARLGGADYRVDRSAFDVVGAERELFSNFQTGGDPDHGADAGQGRGSAASDSAHTQPARSFRQRTVCLGATG